MNKLPSMNEIRHINLRTQMARLNVTPSDLSRLLDKSIGQVSQFAGPKQHKGIGDDMARLIEEKLSLPYYSLDSAHQALQQFKDEFDVPLSNAQVIAYPKARIPVVGTTSAGQAIEIVDLYQPGVAEEWVEAYGNPGPTAFALRLDGFSMEEKFYSDDLVQIEPDLEWKPNDFVFAKRLSDNHGTFKQLKLEDGSYYLFALNEAFTPRYLKMDEDWVVVGKATWKLTRL